MASTLKHLRSSSADKRPTASGLADGQLAINTASGTPGLFFKDSGNGIVKVGPAHVDATAPNATPAGSAGNSKGEFWVDTNLVPSGLKVWNGSSFSNLTPSGSETIPGLLEVATPAEVQAGTDHQRAVTASGLQSKISDSTSTSSSTTIASSTAVKSAYDLANAALPKTGGTVTGAVVISPSGSLSFEGSTDDGFETTISVVDPTADRTFFIPNITGTGITTADTSTVTNNMLAGSIADSKLSTISTADKVSLSALNIDGGTDIGAALADADLFIVDDGGAGTNRKAAANRITDYAFGKVSGDITITSSGVAAIGSGKVTSTMIADGTIVDADISATAEIAVSKLADGTARQLLQTDSAGTGVEWASNIDIPGTLDVTGAATFDNSVTIASGLTVDTNTLFVDSTNNRVAIGTNSTSIIDTKGFNANALISKDALSGLVLRTSGNAASSENLIFYNDYIDTSLQLTVDHLTIGGVGSVAQATFAGTGLNSVAFNADASLTSSAFYISGFKSTTITHDYVYLNTLTSTNYATFNGTTQQFSVTGGSASAPSVAFLGDLDTGIYSPAANTAAISTGGSERLRIDSSGRVGIGTTAPNALLEVSAGTAISTNGIIRIAGTNTNGTASNFCELAATQDVDLTSSALTFSTRLSGTLSEKVRIDKNGRVGIGTASPSNILEIGGEAIVRLLPSADNTSSSIYLGRTTTLGNRYRADITADTNGLFFATAAAVNTTPTERARIDSSGRLLVGTSSARSVGGLTNQVQVEGVNAGTYSQSWVRNVAGTGGATIYLGKSRSGSLGGVTIVNANDQLGGVYFCGADGVDLDTPGASIEAYVDGTPGANDMPGRLVFSTTADGAASPTERVRIDSSGRLLVGTSSATAGCNSVFQGNSATPTGASLIYIQRGSANPGASTLGILRFSDSNQAIGAEIGAVAESQWASSDYPSALTFSTTADGAPSPTERLRIDSSGYLRLAGAGIQFNGDTAAANALDDYEEGTWTVNFYDASTGGNVSSTTPTGYYTKVGNLCTMTFAVTNISTSGLTAANVFYYSLPFTSKSSVNNYGVISADTLTFTSGFVGSVIGSAAARGFMVRTSTAAVDANIIVSNVSTGVTDLRITITYQTA